MKKYNWKRYLVYDIHRIIGCIPFLLWFRPKVVYINDEAKEKAKPFNKDGGAIVVLNHPSHSDPAYVQLCFLKRHKNILTADNLVKSKFVNFIMKILGGILIDRDKFSVDSYRKIINILKEDRLIILYPEGKIVKEDEGIGEFKSGFVSFAIHSNKPIIPMYIKKRHNIFKRLVMVIGEPIYCDKTNDKTKIANMVREKIIELKDHMELGVKK